MVLALIYSKRYEETKLQLCGKERTRSSSSVENDDFSWKSEEGLTIY